MIIKFIIGGILVTVILAILEVLFNDGNEDSVSLPFLNPYYPSYNRPDFLYSYSLHPTTCKYCHDTDHGVTYHEELKGFYHLSCAYGVVHEAMCELEQRMS